MIDIPAQSGLPQPQAGAHPEVRQVCDAGGCFDEQTTCSQ